MGFVMDLIAGDRRDILGAIAAGDWAGMDDRARFAAHLSLGGALDPTWLDLFSEAVRASRKSPGSSRSVATRAASANRSSQVGSIPPLRDR